jgi:GTP-binding protein Era
MDNFFDTNIKAVIFDLDGVLFNTTLDIAHSVNLTFRHFGYKELPLKKITSFIGNGIRTLIKRAVNESVNRDSEYGITAFSDNWNESTAEEDAVYVKEIKPDANFGFQDIVSYYKKCYTENPVIHSTPYPGIIETLKILYDKKIPIAVATNKPHQITVEIFKIFDILKYFDAILGPEDVEHIKPSGDMLKKANELINKKFGTNITAEQMLMVGDSDSDIKAAREAGTKSLAVSGGYGNKEKLKAQKADWYVQYASEFFLPQENSCKTDSVISSQKSDHSMGNKNALVAIIGRPSVGKSSFLNTATGEKVSIVSPTPQTTRNAIRGIVNTSLGQLVFVDTPGYHDSEKKLNVALKTLTQEQLDSADAILYILDSTRTCGDEEKMIIDMIQPYAAKTVVAVNKIDLPESNAKHVHDFLSIWLKNIPSNRIFDISAREDKNINDVLRALYDLSEEGEQLYPEEYYTDQEVDFRIAEIIREQAINRLYDELPHAVYVDISDMQWRKNGKELWVRAFLVVEKESQKGMVIGKGAAMIKTIRVESIKACRKIFDYRVDIDLQVKVNKNWRQKNPLLAKLVR